MREERGAKSSGTPERARKPKLQPAIPLTIQTMRLSHYSPITPPAPATSTPPMDTQGRLGAVLQQLDRIHAQDPQKPAAAEYHAALGRYCTLLAQTSPVLATDTLSEGLVLAQNAQHVARWTRPRSEYPLGLAGYKMWRVRPTLLDPTCSHLRSTRLDSLYMMRD